MPHVVDEMLEVVRCHLGMDIAFVSSFEGGRRFFRHVSSGVADCAVRIGDSHELDATYCTRVVSGALPPLTPDAMVEPAVRDLSITADLGIRAYAGVPIAMSDGTVYGTLCAFASHTHDFVDDDVHALELAARLIAHRLQGLEIAAEADQRRRQALVDEVTREGTVRTVFQPILTLRTGVVRGYEALARFHGEEVRRPEDWFALARRLDFDTLLQRQAAGRALAHLAELPDDQFLTLNFSDDALGDEGVADLLATASGERLVVELTEHEPQREDCAFHEALSSLRGRGVRIAIDDVGAGYAGLQRVLQLAPEFIKLDRALITGVWEDVSRQAMVRAFTTFAASVGSEVIAEGIEQQVDADALRILGVGLGQGFLLGEPTDLPEATPS